MLREDGTGAIEYFYGKMGEVTKTRRTLIVPNQAIATYVTQWTYDSHNRLLEMIYPDEEKITYSYNLGGQLEKVHGYKSYGYDYVSKIGYDKFEQRTYLKYCNGAETFYTYDPQRRRLQNLTVNSGGNTIMDNAYTYDAVSNVLSVVNGASVPQSGKAGGQMAHTYTYDALYRLVNATGTYTGADNKTASYTLAMGYDNMHRITSKRQILTQNNVQFDGTLNAGYDLSYTYGTDTGKKFQLANVKDINYRTEETPSESENVNNNHAYEYDANGNLVYVNTSRTKKDGVSDEKTTERKLKWDEENRLLASDDNGFVTNYWYDADGERTVKTSGESDQVYVNSEFAGGRTNTAKFSLYVSPYLVANQGGRYTKHIYIGSQRVVSKIGDFDSYGSDPRRIQYAGSETDGLAVDYKQKYVQQLQVIKDNYATFAVPYNGEDNNDYVDGKGFCCNDGSLEAAQARVMARAMKNNFQEGDSYEKMQFYYHPDHLGSSSYITNLDGEVVQHIEYVPFGEVFVEERNNIWNTPYLFNAKEFDEETGLYYYGARYYDPRVNVWISVDPISNYDPLNSENYIDGEHNNGVYNSFNINPYIYCYQSPIILIDPNGKQTTFTNWWNKNNMTTRVAGLAKGVGGVVEASVGVIGGVATSWTGAGGIVGGIALIHGSDVAASGFSQMITGRETSSFTSQGLQFSGMSKGTADTVDAGVSMLLTGGASSAASSTRTVAPMVNGTAKSVNSATKTVSTASSKNVATKIHGNSLKNPAPTWGYKLYSNDGTFLKNGITSKPVAESRYPKWYMSDKYMIKQLFPNRRAAYEWEYKQNTIQRGPLNKNMH